MHYFQFEFGGPGFVAVPNHVARLVSGGRLSAEALGVLVVMALHPPGSRGGVAETLAACGIGVFVWRRVSKELRDVGALIDGPVKRLHGRFCGGFVFGWPPKSGRAKKSKKADRSSVYRKRETASDTVQFTARGKPTDGEAQAFDVVEIFEVETCENVVPLRLKTGEAVAPSGAAAASPVDNSTKPALAELWSRAEFQAGLGFPWLHPVSGRQMLACDWIGCASGADVEAGRSAENGARL